MSSTKLFADDMKLYRLLRDTKEDVEELQKDLIRLESWSHVWQLKFNTDKCDPPQEFDAKGESTLTTRLHDTLSVP